MGTFYAKVTGTEIAPMNRYVTNITIKMHRKVLESFRKSLAHEQVKARCATALCGVGVAFVCDSVIDQKWVDLAFSSTALCAGAMWLYVVTSRIKSLSSFLESHTRYRDARWDEN